MEDVVKKYNDLTIKGPSGGETIFALNSKKYGQVFRFDIKLRKTPKKEYYIIPHYHVKPDLSKHFYIPEDGIYWGKNKPPGFGWQNI